MLGTYAVAVFAMLFSASSFLTLMYIIDHFDGPQTQALQQHVADQVAV